MSAHLLAAVAEAEAAVEEAQENLDQLRRDVKLAEQFAKAKSAALDKARIQYDETLPKAEIVTISHVSGSVTGKQTVCVTRKTEKTIFVRTAGCEKDTETQFRQKNGKWLQYPPEKTSRWSPDIIRELILKG